jgi:hypothetical protein
VDCQHCRHHPHGSHLVRVHQPPGVQELGQGLGIKEMVSLKESKFLRFNQSPPSQIKCLYLYLQYAMTTSL